MTRIPAPNLPHAACYGMDRQWTAWEAAALHELRRDTQHRSRYHREVAALDTARDALTICGDCTGRTTCWAWARADNYDGIAGGSIRYQGENVTADPERAEPHRGRRLRLPPPGDLHWLLEQGMDTRRIAHRFGVTRSAVHKALARAGGAA